MKTVIIGAGAGGLAAAIALAAKGISVTVLEAQSGAGGKMLPVQVGDALLDSGPTVLTMRWVFEALLALAGRTLDAEIKMRPLQTLARHYWTGGTSLDLCADPAQTQDNIGHFAGRAEAEGYKAFAAASRSIHQSLLQPFLKSQRPTPWGLAAAMPFGDVLGINPFETYWHALSRYFRDERLRQLFGRYATYCGSSPFKAPATLMLVADVEACGVWRVEGGMASLAACLETCARDSGGVEFHFNCAASRIETAGGRVAAVIDIQGNRHACTSVVVNADATALRAGLFGHETNHTGDAYPEKDRSLSAVTWCGESDWHGIELQHHTVFFSDNYEKEFADLKYGPAQDPTVYCCDQGRSRTLLLINAPANGKCAPADVDERLARRLQKCGLDLKLKNVFRRNPEDFAKLYPATHGALYGRASHGWLSTFQRPAARSKIPGLYLAGGSTHPGPGVPMAALAGVRAAEAIMEDRGLT